MNGTSPSGPGPRIAVVGGGLGGVTAAAAAVRRGLDVTVHESVDTLREDGVHSGSSAFRGIVEARLDRMIKDTEWIHRHDAEAVSGIDRS